MWKHVWSDKRRSLLVGRVGLLVYIYYNYRVLQCDRVAAHSVAWDSFLTWLDAQLDLATGKKVVGEEAGADSGEDRGPDNDSDIESDVEIVDATQQQVDMVPATELQE